jgi:hypothetical protein
MDIDKFGTKPSARYVYEAHGRAKGSSELSYTEIFECDTDDEALALAQDFATEWDSRIKLYRVPFINTRIPSIDLWPDQMKLIADIPKPKP